MVCMYGVYVCMYVCMCMYGVYLRDVYKYLLNMLLYTCLLDLEISFTCKNAHMGMYVCM
jgi:hypothetical protein